jgi:hypothetical protein
MIYEGLTSQELADLLCDSGLDVTSKDIEEDIQNGAPAKNGKLSLLAYVAWLIKRVDNGKK